MGSRDSASTRRNYVAENVVYGAHHADLHFRRVPHLPLHALTRDPFWSGATAAFAGSSTDLVHLYNEIGWSSRPIVVSFEDEIPRGRKRRRSFALGLRTLASPRVRALLAMSAARARIGCSTTPSLGPLLGPKCVVVVPSVPRRDDAYARHRAFLEASPAGSSPLELLFVGAQFFRKGGPFLLDALEPLAARGEPRLRLTLVTRFEPDGYATPFDAGDAARARARVASCPWIRHLEAARPDDVRDLMATSHALLFPTLDETFGFVAAEALATGLEVVASSVRALPEILTAAGTAAAVPYELEGRDLAGAPVVAPRRPPRVRRRVGAREGGGDRDDSRPRPRVAGRPEPRSRGRRRGCAPATSSASRPRLSGSGCARSTGRPSVGDEFFEVAGACQGDVGLAGGRRRRARGSGAAGLDQRVDEARERVDVAGRREARERAEPFDGLAGRARHEHRTPDGRVLVDLLLDELAAESVGPRERQVERVARGGESKGRVVPDRRVGLDDDARRRGARRPAPDRHPDDPSAPVRAPREQALEGQEEGRGRRPSAAPAAGP